MAVGVRAKHLQDVDLESSEEAHVTAHVQTGCEDVAVRAAHGESRATDWSASTRISTRALILGAERHVAQQI